MLGLHTYLLHRAAQQQHIITREIIITSKTATTMPAIAPAPKDVDWQFEFAHVENVVWQQSVAHYRSDEQLQPRSFFPSPV